MIAIINYNAGNTKSVENAVRRQGYDCVITDDLYRIADAEKVIFPGVGEAHSAMSYLQAKGLDKTITALKQPVLGICLGLQIMCNKSEEGNVGGLGIFDTDVVKFPPLDKVPHTGWNNFTSVTGPLFTGINLHDDVYYVHSYYAGINRDTIAACNYITPFSAAMNKDNFYGVQFHAEKSGPVGEQILKNFLQL